MRKLLSAIIVIFLGLMLCSAASADAKELIVNSVTIDGRSYKMQVNDNYIYADMGNDEVAIVLYIGKDPNVDLNGAVAEKKVTRVEDKAFLSTDSFLGDFHEKSCEIDGKRYKCTTNIKQLILPDCLIYIGYMSFVDNYLTTVDFPADIRTVGYHCFAGNPISEIPFIPGSAEVNAPFGDSSVKTLTFDERYSAIPGNFVTFENMTTLEIHDNITSIGDGAFYYCTMKNIVFPDGLERIGKEAFRECKVSKVVLPAHVSKLGASAFCECDQLSSVELSDDLTEINDSTFINCAKLSSVVIKNNVSRIGKEAFSGCKSLRDITLPDNLESIDNYAFFECKKISKIVIPATTKTIGIEAFSGCSALASVSLPANVEKISDDAFSGCAQTIKFDVISGSYGEEWAVKNGYNYNVIYPVTSIMLDVNDAVITTAKGVNLTPTVEPQTATNKKLEWSSTDTNIATVQNGKVKSVATGKCDIICRAVDGSGVQAVCHVEVRTDVKSVSINEKQVNLLVGSSEKLATEQLTYTVAPEDAYWQNVTWESSDESIATVSADGVVKGISAGKATITATSTQPDSKVKAKVQVAVQQAVTGIELSEKQLTIDAGKGATLIAAVNPDNAGNKKVEWSSSDETVATVNGGKIKAVSNGECDIICNAVDGSGVQAYCHVTVIQMVRSIQFIDKKLTIPYEQSLQPELVIQPAEATNKKISWSSSDESICSVSDDGIITAVAPGDCEIIATTMDGSEITAKLPVHVSVFDTAEVEQEVTKKSETVISIDYRGLSYKDFSHQVSDESKFLYYLDDEGIHVFPLSKGSSVITLSSNLNKEDVVKYNITINESAVYDTSDGTKEPLHGFIYVDPASVKPGEKARIRYYVAGGSEPYTVCEVQSVSSDWRGTSLSERPRIKKLPKGELTPNVDSCPGYGPCMYYAILDVVDAEGKSLSIKSNIVDIETLDFVFDYDVYALKEGEPFEIGYKITGGSGKYKIEVTASLENGESGSWRYVDIFKGKSESEGVVKYLPQAATKFSIQVHVTDEKNKKLSGRTSTTMIHINKNGSVRVRYDKDEMTVKDILTAYIEFDGLSKGIIDYAFWRTSADDTSYVQDFKEESPGLYSTTYKAAKKGYCQLNLVLRGTEAVWEYGRMYRVR